MISVLDEQSYARGEFICSLKFVLHGWKQVIALEHEILVIDTRNNLASCESYHQ